MELCKLWMLDKCISRNLMVADTARDAVGGLHKSCQMSALSMPVIAGGTWPVCQTPGTYGSENIPHWWPLFTTTHTFPFFFFAFIISSLDRFFPHLYLLLSFIISHVTLNMQHVSQQMRFDQYTVYTQYNRLSQEVS